MPISFKDLKVELSHLLLGRVLIVGIGNQLRADDGFGPFLINRLQGKIKADCLDVGSSPENYIGKIVKLKPDVILFVDAVSIKEEPSTLRLIKAEQIPEYGFSTHNMSPRLMIDNIKSQIKTKIFMLGIEPENLEFGEPISKNVLEKLVLIENILIEILGNNEFKK